MGINGLLPLLKSIHKQVNLKKFEGKTIGVDAYGWLHRGAVACAMELATGKPTKKFVDFAMHRVRMLQHFGVTPYLIFDGDYLPSKAATEKDREGRRAESRRAGLELLNAGKTSQAFLEFQKAVDVTPEMARQLIDELKKVGVEYIVAPYEADAQMAYLERQEVIDAILSEDSDLLVFGSKCLLTKLDQYGNCVEINRANFCACREINLTGWSDAEFRRMAILSGCDYLASMNNMGLKTAYRMVRKHKSIEKVLQMLQFDGKYTVPKGYLHAFYKAELTFLHQRVFCPKTLALVLHINPEKPIDEDKLPFIGAFVEPEIAQGVARGDLHPMTKKTILTEQRKMISTVAGWSTPVAQPRRSVSSIDAMKFRPIDKFFTKRVPLAELNPNLFYRSPSQQSILHRNPSPWLAQAAPRPYLNPSSTVTEQVPHSAPPSSRTATRQIDSGPSTTSEPRPPKRARLCAETESPNKQQNAGVARSRFFSSTAPDASPTATRNVEGRRSNKSDITIFSDDSIDEALSNLTDFEDFAKPVIQAPVFEGRSIEANSSIATSNSIDLSDANDSVSQSTTPSLTHTTSTMSSSPDEEACKVPFKSDSTLNLKDKFSFPQKDLTTPISKVNYQGLSTPSSSASAKPSRIPVATKSTTISAKTSVTAMRMNLTPLQRLGASAINRTQSQMTHPYTPANPSRGKSMLFKAGVPFPEVSTREKSKEPAMIPLPLADGAENIALAGEKGSEDLIVHDSEEDEALSPRGARPGLKLGQFFFSG